MMALGQLSLPTLKQFNVMVFSATKAVDPNMVLKKKGGTEEEVQEGWVGRIIPFELAQKEFLYAEMAALKAHEDRLTEIASSYC